MGKPNKRKHRPVSVAEAEAILDRARRREAAQAGRPTVRRRVDLANLDTPEVTHAEQYAEFLNRPGRFYVATIEIPLDDKALGEKLATTTTFKADDDQLLYLVEVLRQIRGAFGQHCRINLTPAEPHVEERRIAGPAVRQARSRVEEVRVGPDPAERPATPEELAAVREMRRRAAAEPNLPGGGRRSGTGARRRGCDAGLTRSVLRSQAVLSEREGQTAAKARAAPGHLGVVGVEGLERLRGDPGSGARRGSKRLRARQRHVPDDADLLAASRHGDIDIAVTDNGLGRRRCVRESKASRGQQRSSKNGACGRLLHRVHTRSLSSCFRQGSRAARGSPHSPEGGHRPP